MNVRTAATRALLEVVCNGRSLADVLPCFFEKIRERDRALLQAICFGVCRFYYQLDDIAKKLLAKPLKTKDQDIFILILIGLYQLIYMRLPDYAAISETVLTADSLKKSWAKGLINGVLRNFQRNADLFKSEHDAHPTWLRTKIKKDYRDMWQNILAENNKHPPFALRVNLQSISREEYIKLLADDGITAKIIPETKAGIVIDPVDVKDLPGFNDGLISVQDGAAQLAVELLDLKAHQRVLDACAAPGGKTTYILELQRDIDCVAVDIDGERIKSLKENLQRLNLTAKVLTADVLQVDKWWDCNQFDRILLDAPCSGSGVMRRHPDIKLLRRESDIEKLAQTQLQLLNRLWPLLKPGGKLLYVTCSIFSDENIEVINKFLEKQEEVVLEQMRQILPGENNMDGFYFALLRNMR